MLKSVYIRVQLEVTKGFYRLTDGVIIFPSVRTDNIAFTIGTVGTRLFGDIVLTSRSRNENLFYRW